MNVSNIFVPQWYTAEVAEHCDQRILFHKSICAPAVSMGVTWIRHDTFKRNHPEFLMRKPRCKGFIIFMGLRKVLHFSEPAISSLVK